MGVLDTFAEVAEKPNFGLILIVNDVRTNRIAKSRKASFDLKNKAVCNCGGGFNSPKNEEQLAALKTFAKALKIDFETAVVDSVYDPEFVKKIQQGREDVRKGKGVKIALEDLWK